MSAWFNYYVNQKAEYFAYIFGAQAQADVDTGLIKLITDATTTNLVTNELINAVELNWDSYNHPILAGYHIYQRLAAEPPFGSPLASIDLAGLFKDFEVVGGQAYTYAVRCFDTAGNLYQLSREITITFEPEPVKVIKNYVPYITGA